MLEFDHFSEMLFRQEGVRSAVLDPFHRDHEILTVYKQIRFIFQFFGSSSFYDFKRKFSFGLISKCGVIPCSIVDLSAVFGSEGLVLVFKFFKVTQVEA